MMAQCASVFGGWDKVRKEHFAAGGLLDQAYGSR